jgi:hypothetical protein
VEKKLNVAGMKNITLGKELLPEMIASFSFWLIDLILRDCLMRMIANTRRHVNSPMYNSRLWKYGWTNGYVIPPTVNDCMF